MANGVPFDKVNYMRIELPKPIKSLGEPTYTATAEGWHMQHVLYRLNGDYNPLHIGAFFPFYVPGERSLRTTGPPPSLIIHLHRETGKHHPSSSRIKIDPTVGKQFGFPGVVSHGLAMYSMTARAILAKLCNNAPLALKSMFGQVTGAPLIPGGELSSFLVCPAPL